MTLLIEKWIYNGHYAISVVHCWCHSWHIQSSSSVSASNPSQVPLHLQRKGLLEGYTRMFPAEERECWWQKCVYQVSLSKFLWSVWDTWKNVTGTDIELEWIVWDGFIWLSTGPSGRLFVNMIESLQVSWICWVAGKLLAIEGHCSMLLFGWYVRLG